MTVEAYDDQYPNNRGSSRVVITVTRNPNTPTFLQSQYVASVFEYDPASKLVVNTTATDLDGVGEICYDILFQRVNDLSLMLFVSCHFNSE